MLKLDIIQSEYLRTEGGNAAKSRIKLKLKQKLQDSQCKPGIKAAATRAIFSSQFFKIINGNRNNFS